MTPASPHRSSCAAPPAGTTLTVLQDLLYTAYDKAGNLATISDTTPSYPGSSAPLLSAGRGYQYDGLGRLAQATSHGFAWPQGSSSFGYDDLENLSTARGLGLTHSGAHPHQIQSSSTPGSGSAYGYDGNGALESRPDTDGAGEDAALSVEYDLQGRVARVEGGGTTVEYVSESSGMRAARRIGSQVTFYFGPAFEVTGASLVRHVRFGGRHIAESTITMAATSPLAMARIDGELRETLVARALLDFAAESPRLYPLVSLSREEGTRLFALLLLSLILLGATPGRVRLGLAAGRRAPFRRLRRGHVAVLLAVFGASLTPLTCVRPAEAGGGGGGGGGGNPPPPSYPVYFLHHDHLGSTVMATCYKRPAGEECADGEVVRYFRYDAYGMTKAFDGAGAPVTTQGLLVDRLYTGQRFEQAVRLYDYHARFYEPRIARFLSIDPARQHPNPFAYVGWQPTAMIDPSGEVFGPAHIGFTSQGVEMVPEWSFDFMVEARMNPGLASKGFGSVDPGAAGDEAYASALAQAQLAEDIASNPAYYTALADKSGDSELQAAVAAHEMVAALTDRPSVRAAAAPLVGALVLIRLTPHLMRVAAMLPRFVSFARAAIATGTIERLTNAGGRPQFQITTKWGWDVAQRVQQGVFAKLPTATKDGGVIVSDLGKGAHATLRSFSSGASMPTLEVNLPDLVLKFRFAGDQGL